MLFRSSGVPDFDQKQDNWNAPPGSGPWTFCGPVAAANSLWWFDSKFEPSPVWPMSLPANDTYFLVTSYTPGGYDDHDPLNVGGIGPLGLVDHLACYFNTDGRISPQPTLGTEVHQMSYGLQNYLYNDPSHICYSMAPSRQGSYYDDYHVQLVKQPAWPWVVDEVLRSEDVILLLGFWQEQPAGSGVWVRVGGHYVTVAGIDAADQQIAFSDPFWDNAESGGPGRVLSGTIFLPHSPGHAANIHNDAGNVSHDIYTVTLATTSPAGAWEIVGYPYPTGDFSMQNCPDEYIPDQGTFSAAGGPVMTEVEYALAMSPFKWKPGGEWVHTFYAGEWIWEWWSYEDDGDSCLPDFAWDDGEPFYDGPTALANSLWWFDSKAETLVTGGWPESPPTVVDNYPLLTAYGPWDDHAITNTKPFIADLAAQLDTTAEGISRETMVAGIDAYLTARGATSAFYTHTQDSPSFAWVADEVETCEDVILLLGFYEDMADGSWERKGGHWVNAAGVSRAGGMIGISDPYTDAANVQSFFDVMYTGRVFPPEHLGTPFTAEEKQDPQAISHDIYAAADSPLTEYAWALADYPATALITDFVGLNEGGLPWTSYPISTVVEWAIGVSPYSDLSIEKTASDDEVPAGETVTFTIAYTNKGLAAAENVSIVERLPLDRLTGLAYQANPPLDHVPGITFTWQIPKLTYGQQGVITVTGIAVTDGPISNTVYITGQNAIGLPTPDRDESSNAAIWPDPTWTKWVDGLAWIPHLTIPVETWETHTVVDVITTQHALTLTEVWTASHLALTQYTVDPPAAGVVMTGPGWLRFHVLPGQTVTLTKLFQVQPCTWTQTLLQESLFSEYKLLESRAVSFAKRSADLTIGSLYTPAVSAGETATFTLLYGNNGGVENDVWIRNVFPSKAPLLTANPLADRVGASGLWAEWDIGDLGMSQTGRITVAVAISPTVRRGDRITITDWIYDHLDRPVDETQIVFQAQGWDIYLPVVMRQSP